MLAIGLTTVGLAHTIYVGVYYGKNDDDISVEDIVSVAELIGAIITVITYLLLVIFIYFQRLYGFVNGGAIWFFIGFELFCTAISIPTYIRFSDHHSTAELIFIYIEFALLIIIFLICSFPDRVSNMRELLASDTLYGKEGFDFEYEKNVDLKKKKKKICPIETASFPSKLTFSWLDRIVWTGYRRPLSIDDLWQVRLTDRARKLFERYNEIWGHKSFSELNDYKTPKVVNNNNYTNEKNNIEYNNSNLNNNGNNNVYPMSTSTPTIEKSPKNNLVTIISTQFWSIFLWPSLARLITDNLQLVNPTVMK